MAVIFLPYAVGFLIDQDERVTGS